MSITDLKRFEIFTNLLNGCSVGAFCNYSLLSFHNSNNESGIESLDDGMPRLRVFISVVYFIVATAGVLGNLLVMFLLYSTHTITAGTINFFVFNLALADLLFSLALPFWAVDIVLDYSWPFGLATCKAVSLLTGLNFFASCFFLTAMSLTRYCYVATALKPGSSLCNRSSTFPVTTAIIWVGALIMSVPRAVFADLRRVGSGNDTACLLRFPDGTAWLGINQLLRVVVGFLLPYTIIILSYLLLLRFLCKHKLKGSSNTRRKANVSKSVAVLVLSFCACWFPYNVLTLWSVLIQLDIIEISKSFYSAQTYFFPLANCLAFTSSCFNPVIYCLVRKEYRTVLHNCFFKMSLTFMSKMPYALNSEEVLGQGGQLGIPLSNVYSQTCQTDSRGYIPLTTLPAGTSPLYSVNTAITQS